jgi:hypothetical protein
MLFPLVFFLSLATVRDCGNGQGRATITSLNANPASPVAGENYTLTVNYDLSDPPITGGTAEYSATLNYFPIYNENFDLCTETRCPKEVGPNVEQSITTVPSGVGGKLVTTVKWTDQNDALVWCVETTLKL